MSKIEWEYDLVERPFREHLKEMGWQWIEGDKDVPEFTERANFREVLLKARLAAALRNLNLRDGKPWLDDERIARAIRDLEQAPGHRLMEITFTQGHGSGGSAGLGTGPAAAHPLC